MEETALQDVAVSLNNHLNTQTIMSKKLTLQEEFKTFINSLENSELIGSQQILLSTYGGTDTMMAYDNVENEDIIFQNNNQGCNTINNCKGSNCVPGCGKS